MILALQCCFKTYRSNNMAFIFIGINFYIKIFYPFIIVSLGFSLLFTFPNNICNLNFSPILNITLTFKISWAANAKTILIIPIVYQSGIFFFNHYIIILYNCIWYIVWLINIKRRNSYVKIFPIYFLKKFVIPNI